MYSSSFAVRVSKLNWILEKIKESLWVSLVNCNSVDWVTIITYKWRLLLPSSVVCSVASLYALNFANDTVYKFSSLQKRKYETKEVQQMIFINFKIEGHNLQTILLNMNIKSLDSSLWCLIRGINACSQMTHTYYFFQGWRKNCFEDLNISIKIL